jgi:Icc-related predicted phosphoesterase
LKILIISDTHGLHRLVPELPEADVFIHAGDIANSGRIQEEYISFNTWLEGIPVPKHRRFICAGNHDVWLDGSHNESSPKRAAKTRALITNGIYVENEAREVDGVIFYFSPVTPFFLNWGFNVQRGADIKKYWDKIPDNTDVLVTHGPPYGILDKIVPESSFLNLGCEELEKRVRQIQPKYHIFGHIHGSRGTFTESTTYINASFLNEEYKPHSGDGYFIVEI